MRKFIKISLYMAELLADTKAKAYFTAKNQIDDVEHREYVQELDDDGNVDIMLRSFENAIGKASAVISEYAPVELEETSNALISSTDDIILVVSMPENYNEGLTNTLAQVLHKYLVDTAVADWFIEAMPEASKQAATYYNMASDDLTQLRNALTRRLRPARSEIVPDIIPYSGSGTYNEKSDATISFSVSTVSILVGGTTTNTATTNSTGDVTYSITDSTIATIDSTTGLVTGVTSGSATVTATVAETDDYNSASATYGIIVRVAQSEGDQ